MLFWMWLEEEHPKVYEAIQWVKFLTIPVVSLVVSIIALTSKLS